jgi:hypothetical protein
MQMRRACSDLPIPSVIGERAVTGAFTSYLRRLLGAFSDATSNSRTEPEDLLRLRPASAYVVAPCNRARTAESVARKLLEAGFDRSELVLVSNRVHTLHPYPDQDALEVVGSLRAARQSGGVAGLVTGACFGALLGILYAGVMVRTPSSYAYGAFVGGLVGIVAGALLGRFWAAALRRRPDALYDEQLADDQILIGVGVGDGTPGRADDAFRLMKEAGLDPRRVRGEDAAAPATTPGLSGSRA